MILSEISYILHDSRYTRYAFWKGKNYWNSKKISGCHCSGVGREWIGRAHRIVRAVKTVCTMPWLWIYGIIIFLNPCNVQHQKWTSRWELWVITMYHCKFISCKKYAIMLLDAGSGKVCGSAGMYEKFSFAVDLILLLKIKAIKIPHKTPNGYMCY